MKKLLSVHFIKLLLLILGHTIMQCHVIQGAGRMRLRLVVHELRRILFHRLALTGTESW